MILGIIIGAFIGGCVGVVIMAIVQMAKEDEPVTKNDGEGIEFPCPKCGKGKHTIGYTNEKPPIHVHKVVAEDPRFATVCASCEISDMMLYGTGNASEVVDLAVKDITHQLAEAIIPFTEFRVSRIEDPLRQTRAIQGSVRVKRLEHSDLGHRHFINEMLNLP